MKAHRGKRQTINNQRIFKIIIYNLIYYKNAVLSRLLSKITLTWV